VAKLYNTLVFLLLAPFCPTTLVGQLESLSRFLEIAVPTIELRGRDGTFLIFSTRTLWGLKMSPTSPLMYLSVF